MMLRDSQMQIIFPFGQTTGVDHIKGFKKLSGCFYAHYITKLSEIYPEPWWTMHAAKSYSLLELVPLFLVSCWNTKNDTNVTDDNCNSSFLLLIIFVTLISIVLFDIFVYCKTLSVFVCAWEAFDNWGNYNVHNGINAVTALNYSPGYLVHIHPYWDLLLESPRMCQLSL